MSVTERPFDFVAGRPLDHKSALVEVMVTYD